MLPSKCVDMFVRFCPVVRTLTSVSIALDGEGAEEEDNDDDEEDAVDDITLLLLETRLKVAMRSLERSTSLNIPSSLPERHGSGFLFFCAECKVDADCKWNNEKCDQEDHICRPICTDHEDCNSIPCNTDKGVCDPSKILFNCKDLIKQILNNV